MIRYMALLALTLLSTCTVCFAVPTVSNVTASQRTDGSKKVDIYYNLADPDSATSTVSVQVSDDGGGTWTVVASQLSGDVGPNVSCGNGKHIVWESCGTDLPCAYGTNYKVSVTAGGAMIYIPAGSFLMGNNGSEPYSLSRELPQHSVYLSGYWIGKYEVTRGEYRAFMNATGRAAPAYWAAVQDWGTGSFTQTDNHPVVGVTWYDAAAYCAWAGGRLPTEAEWEKAARWTGSYPNVYPWGNSWDQERCNNWYDSNPAGGGYQKRQTAPVGSYPSGGSPYGLQDMAGNVWEWCQDWYKSYPGSTSPFDYTNSYRVLRGGSWVRPRQLRPVRLPRRRLRPGRLCRQLRVSAGPLVSVGIGVCTMSVLLFGGGCRGLCPLPYAILRNGK